MRLRGQRHHRVGHAQSRADDAHRRVLRQRGDRLGIPGFQPLGCRQAGGSAQRQRPQRIAHRQHHAGGVQGLAIVELQQRAIGIGVQRLHAGAVHDERCRALHARGLQAIAQVGRVVPAPHESLRQPCVFQLRAAGVRTQVIDEILRCLHQRTHPRGGHIEQMFRPRGGVGHALAQHRVRLDHHDLHRRHGLTQQLQRHQHPRCATANDGDHCIAGITQFIHPAIVGDASRRTGDSGHAATMAGIAPRTRAGATQPSNKAVTGRVHSSAGAFACSAILPPQTRPTSPATAGIALRHNGHCARMDRARPTSTHRPAAQCPRDCGARPGGGATVPTSVAARWPDSPARSRATAAPRQCRSRACRSRR